MAHGHSVPDQGQPARSTHAAALPPFALAAADVAAGLGTDPTVGLSAGEAADRLAQLGPNAITSEKPPSLWVIALGQFRNPMNIMLVAVSIVSFAIDETSTGIIVALLIILNVVLGSRQELKARESVTALSNLQVPHAKVIRGGTLVSIPAVDVVPGDVVQVEAGDLVPADGRIIHSATLETQEAALTGESAPVPKDAERARRRGRRARRSLEHAVPEHLRDAGDRGDGRHRHGNADGDGSDRADAVVRDTNAIAPAARARLVDEGPRAHRLDRGRLHRRRRPCPGLGRGRALPARHGDGDLRDPDRSSGLCLRTAVAGRQAARRRQGHREEPR